LLVPLGVELLSDLCAAVNPAFDSRIFLTVRRVFLLGATDDGGPEAPVISTSDSLLLFLIPDRIDILQAHRITVLTQKSTH